MTSNGQQPRKALLLDGDALSARRIRRALRQQGFEVLSAPDGEQGLSLLIDELLHLDVLVMSVDLPLRDGWSLLRLVRAAGGERDLRIVMVGRGLDAARREQLRWLGADAVAGDEEGAHVVARAARPDAAQPAPASWSGGLACA